MTNGIKILVVDDEPGVRWALEMILHRSGFAVASVGSGKEALGWLSHQSCHVILMDAKLGDIEGVVLAKQIQTTKASTAPVVLVSGYFYKDDSTIQNNLKTGVISAFVTKPFRHDEILKAIQSVLMSGQHAIPMAPTP